MQHYYLKEMRGFASTYGCSAYGTGGYTQSATCGAGTSTGGNPESGSNLLVNTGIAISLIVGIAALLLLVAMLVRFWRRPANPALETVPVEDGQQPFSNTDDLPPRQ